MGFDLTSESGADFRFGGTGWTFYLNLAEAYGWKPAGTLPPAGITENAWSGQYDSNDGQRVTAADALALGGALDRALADPERPVKERELAHNISESLTQHLGEAVSIEPPDDDALLRAFGGFCRGGSFIIE